MEYNLELEKAVSEIKKEKARKVCIQLPDGLKPKAKEIADRLSKETNAEIFIHLGTCFGACDIPENLKSAGIDLLIQFGHAKFG